MEIPRISGCFDELDALSSHTKLHTQPPLLIPQTRFAHFCCVWSTRVYQEKRAVGKRKMSCTGCKLPFFVKGNELVVSCSFPFCRIKTAVAPPAPVPVQPQRPNQCLFSFGDKQDAPYRIEEYYMYHVEKQTFDCCYECDSDIIYATKSNSKLVQPGSLASNMVTDHNRAVRMRFRVRLACFDPGMNRSRRTCIPAHFDAF